MHEENIDNDLQQIISQAISDMKKSLGIKFDPDSINLAELGRRTGLSRSKLRRLKKNGFIVTPNGNAGKKKATHTVISGFTGVIDDLLTQGVTNSEVCFERIKAQGYKGGLTTIKVYISRHKDLVPVRRQQISTGNRGRRYNTGPGECYQMDWGFVNVTDNNGNTYRVACFAMICHHCGAMYAEFFPNAKQENLFIGMLHAFQYLGVPEYILTDNMKSVILKRDNEGHPVWNHDYETFMLNVGFTTRVCKPRHPFTKGAVERLVRFIKENFIVARTFSNVTELNYEILRWCNDQNSRYHKAVNYIPAEEHRTNCMKHANILTITPELKFYLCPLRHISFDGFVTYEGRRFGVPFAYHSRACRVMRDGYTLYIYDADLANVIVTHNVTWSRYDSFCHDQYESDQPEELPTAPIKAVLTQAALPDPNSAFEKFNFEEGIWNE